MATRSATLNVMVAAAEKAGRQLRRDFGEVENLQVSRKGPGDFVTHADIKAEQIIADELIKARPGYGLYMEERGEVAGGDKTHRWIVDPLDGTTNFLHGIPHFAIAIALEREGQLVAGLVYNPVSDEMFVAERGQGAFLNNKRIRVSGRQDLGFCVFACGMPHGGRAGRAAFMADVEALLPNIAGLRRFGAAALDLAYVAAGRVDGFWERGLAAWDVAAGAVLVREAGGMVSDLGGGQDFLTRGDIIAAPDALYEPLLNALSAKDGVG